MARKRYEFQPTIPGSTSEQQSAWRAVHNQPSPFDGDQAVLLDILTAIQAASRFSPRVYNRIVRKSMPEGQILYRKDYLVKGYHALVKSGALAADPELLRRLRMKPTRTVSGVAPVTVLTKPYPCPGECIFCPTETRMPKSYLSNEPGGMRALALEFDPYVQTTKRIEQLRNIGHSTDKVELLILGGTWSSYRDDYQEWFIRRCFDAMNGREAATLEQAHVWNETAAHRNVGLVIETRPDHITPREVRRLRWLGVTKVQLGLQSINDDILRLNKRGESVDDARRAMRLLRSAGFKIMVHWMPNLLGATPDSDREDFSRLWSDPALQPDELKIYPVNLLRGTELYDYYARGDYAPYSKDEVVALVADCKVMVPPTCRTNRIMRDIPAGDIVDGTTHSNLRQMAQQHLERTGRACRCIRCREVRGAAVAVDTLALETHHYETDHSREVFLSVVTSQNKLAGYARLSLPFADDAPIKEIRGHALIRQVQVNGPALPVGAEVEGRAQHSGIGAWLIDETRALAREAGFEYLSVIAAVGTRRYYAKLGFEQGDLYMTARL